MQYSGFFIDFFVCKRFENGGGESEVTRLKNAYHVIKLHSISENKVVSLQQSRAPK
jgi:hypothetical protein